ncbi:MAG: tetratricopeptide repeat protein [Oligoflexales bacterium]
MWLSDYPILQEWLHDHRLNRQFSVSESLLMGVGLSILEEDHFDVEPLLKSLDFCTRRSDDLYEDYERVEAALRQDDFDFDQYWSRCSHIVVVSEYAHSFYKSFSEFTQKMKKPSLQFLTAWMAFNLDKPSSCIEVCESIHPPFGAVWTLCGQAQLESGDPDGAIESLTQATQLLPQDLLSWFQLAKACWASQDYELCSESLKVCRKLSPEHPEVLYFSCLVAQRGYPDLLEEIWLTSQSLADPTLLNKVDYVIEFLQMTIVHAHKESASWLIHAAKWSDVFLQQQFLPDVAAVLKGMNDLGWDDLCSKVLAAVRSNLSYDDVVHFHS